MKYEWSGVILLTRDGDIIAMHRDDIKTIRDPGCYGIFGGAAEGDESPLEAAVREIREETNLTVDASDFEFFKLYVQNRDNLPAPAQLSVFVLKDIDPGTLEVNEGQGIKLLQDASDPNIAADIKVAFEDWFTEHSRYDKPMQIEAILKQLCNDLSAYTAAVMLPDYAQNVLKTVYSYNLHPTWAALTNPFDQTTNNGIAFTTGEAVIKNHAGERTLRTASYVHPIESIAVVPIKSADQIVGTLVVLGDDSGIEYNGDTVRIVNEAAQKIAGILAKGNS